MIRPCVITQTLIAASLAAVPVAAPAQISDAVQDSVIVGPGDGSGNSGRVAINIAAGSHNQQAAGVDVAIGDIASVAITVAQSTDSVDLTDHTTSITIRPGAFSNNTGMVSLNITAGSHNQSANLASLAIGNSAVVSDLMLAQASAPTKPAGQSAEGLDPRNDSVVVDDKALGGNSGLVQINLIGGERNSSANTFALNISAGGNP